MRFVLRCEYIQTLQQLCFRGPITGHYKPREIKVLRGLKTSLHANDRKHMKCPIIKNRNRLRSLQLVSASNKTKRPSIQKAYLACLCHLGSGPITMALAPYPMVSLLLRSYKRCFLYSFYGWIVFSCHHKIDRGFGGLQLIAINTHTDR